MILVTTSYTVLQNAVHNTQINLDSYFPYAAATSWKEHLPHSEASLCPFIVSPLILQLRSVAQSCLTLCNPMDCSTPGFPVHHQLPELVQIHVHRVSDATQPSHPLSSPSPPAFNLSQHQSLFQWVGSLHQVGKVLELQLQHHCFQWIFRTDFL